MKGFVKNNRILFICIIVQAVLLSVLFVFSLARPKENSTYSRTNSAEYSGIIMTLPSGSYEVVIDYSTDSDEAYYFIQDDAYIDSALMGNLISAFDKDKNTVTVPFWLYHKTTNFWVQFSGDVNVKSITVRSTNAYIHELMIALILISFLVDFVLARVSRSKDGNEEEIKKNKTYFVIFSTAVVLSLPLMLHYLLDGHDLSFHLMRIEGIKQGILDGTLPVRIDNFALNGQGYADPIFYPNLFLYIPAFFRILGLPILRAYKLFIALTNILGCIIAYASFKGISKSRRAGIIGMIVYSLSPYHIACIYSRGALGEALAYNFIPLVALGLFLLLSKEVSLDSLKKGSLFLILGLSGILESHILSCEMVGIAMIIVLLICVKRVFRVKTFIVLLISAVFTLLVNAFFIVPFLESYGMNLYVFDKMDVFLHENALNLYQVIGARKDLFGYSYYLTLDIRDEIGISLGLALLIGAFFIIYNIRDWIKETKKDSGKIIFGALILGMFFAWMTTYYFPWKQIENIKLVGDLMRVVQYVWRYLGLSTFFLTLSLSVFLGMFDKPSKKTIETLVVAATVILCFFNIESLVANTEFYAPYSEINEERSIIQSEYLFVGTSRGSVESMINAGKPYRRENGAMIFTLPDSAYSVSDISGEEVSEISAQPVSEIAVGENIRVDTPLTYYPYYRAVDLTYNTDIDIAMNENGTVSFFVPSDYVGEVKVYMPEKKRWIAGDIVSILSILGLVVIYFLVGVKPKKREEA